jgi:hypothetical protein
MGDHEGHLVTTDSGDGEVVELRNNWDKLLDRLATCNTVTAIDVVSSALSLLTSPLKTKDAFFTRLRGGRIMAAVGAMTNDFNTLLLEGKIENTSNNATAYLDGVTALEDRFFRDGARAESVRLARRIFLAAVTLGKPFLKEATPVFLMELVSNLEPFDLILLQAISDLDPENAINYRTRRNSPDGSKIQAKEYFQNILDSSNLPNLEMLQMSHRRLEKHMFVRELQSAGPGTIFQEFLGITDLGDMILQLLKHDSEVLSKILDEPESRINSSK